MTLQPARQISIECSIYWEAHAMLRFLSALLTLPLIVILGFLWFGLAQPLARVLSIRLPPGPADPVSTPMLFVHISPIRDVRFSTVFCLAPCVRIVVALP